MVRRTTALVARSLRFSRAFHPALSGGRNTGDLAALGSGVPRVVVGLGGWIVSWDVSPELDGSRIVGVPLRWPVREPDRPCEFVLASFGTLVETEPDRMSKSFNALWSKPRLVAASNNCWIMTDWRLPDGGVAAWVGGGGDGSAGGVVGVIFWMVLPDLGVVGLNSVSLVGVRRFRGSWYLGVKGESGGAFASS